MARQRFIHPQFWEDTTIGQLTPLERLLFIGCFSNADDDGRLLAHPAHLRSVVFKYDNIGVEDVRALRDKMVACCRNLILYQVDGEEYLAFRSWRRWQRPKYPTPSKLPPPEPASRADSAALRVDSPNPGGNLPQSSPALRVDSSLGWVGLGLGRDPAPAALAPVRDAESATEPPGPDKDPSPAAVPSAGEAPPEGWQVLRAYVSANRPDWWLTPAVGRQMIDWAHRIGADVVRLAVEQAVMAGARGWSYVEAVLERWAAAGVTSADQARARIAAHQQDKAAAPGAAPGRRSRARDAPADPQTQELEALVKRPPGQESGYVTPRRSGRR